MNTVNSEKYHNQVYYLSHHQGPEKSCSLYSCKIPTDLVVLSGKGLRIWEYLYTIVIRILKGIYQETSSLETKSKT